MEITGYRDLTPVGAGEFDDRYRAVDETSGATVTIRALRGAAADERLARRLEREVSSGERIGPHPHVVAVLGSGTSADGVPYIVTEHCDGGPLADVVGPDHLWAPADVATLGLQIAGALETAHAAGVLHRDLTPDSIQLEADGTAKLGGFGVSAVEGGQATAALSFTPVHTAPEVVEGKEPTEATDVYQLASVLYTLLAGTPPFGTREDGTMQVLNKILTAPVPPIERDDVPADLTTAIEAAMAKDPAGRTPSAAALAQQLAPLAAAGGTAPAPPPAAPAPPPAAPAPPPAAPAPPPAAPAPPPAAPAPPPAAPAPPPAAPAPPPAAPAPPPAAPGAPVPPLGAAPAKQRSVLWLVLLLVVVAVVAGVITFLLVS